MKTLGLACATAVVVIPIIGTAAHDLRGVAHTKLVDQTVVQQVFATASDVRTRQVIARLNLWPANKPVVICFNGGDAALRGRIAKIAAEWAVGTALRLDFSGSNGRDCLGTDKEDIRIAFVKGDGDWSWIGLESHSHPGASLNLDAFDSDPPNADQFRSDVLHEFGHAIGFWHEQQHPNAPCDYNKVKIEADFNWTDDDYKVNMEKVEQDARKYSFSLYDNKSVMHYSLDSMYFVSGASSPCYIPLNSVLSAGDLNAVRAAYPVRLAVGPGALTRGIERGVLQTLRSNPTMRTMVDRRLGVLSGGAP